MIKIYLKLGDITEVEVDALVNSANNDLILGGGIAGALKRIGGPEIQDECNRIGTIPLGEAAITTAGKLKAKFLIHAAVIPLGTWADARSVRSATKNALTRAAERKAKSIAFPAIGTGIGAFPIDKCVLIMMDEIHTVIKSGTSSLESIYFVLLEEKQYAQFCEELEPLKQHFKDLAEFVQIDEVKVQPPEPA